MITIKAEDGGDTVTFLFETPSEWSAWWAQQACRLRLVDGGAGQLQRCPGSPAECGELRSTSRSKGQLVSLLCRAPLVRLLVPEDAPPERRPCVVL